VSVVTDIILVTAIEDGGFDGQHPNVDKMNEWFQARYRGARLVKVDQHGGGNKAMQCDVFMGAINFLDVDALLAAFKAIEWQQHESVQLMLKQEHEERFTAYQMDSRSSLLRLMVLRPEAADFP
jgi:hypothetical protein